MLLSRVAEAVYWIGRYVERAENTARLVMVTDNLILDLPQDVPLGWEPVLNITGSAEHFSQCYFSPSESSVVEFLVGNRKNPGSIISSLAQARENMRTTRVMFPREAWESLNDLNIFTEMQTTRGLSPRVRYGFLRAIIERSQVFNGLVTSTMSHDDAYTFYRLGCNIERADMTTRVLDVRAGNMILDGAEDLKPFDDIQWMSVLNSLAAYQMYRRHVHVKVQGPDVLQFLLQDHRFPRSVSHCLRKAKYCLEHLTRHEQPLRILGRAQRMIQQADVFELVGKQLNEYVDGFQIVLGDLHDEVAKTYFDSEQAALPKKQHQSQSQSSTSADHDAIELHPNVA